MKTDGDLKRDNGITKVLNNNQSWLIDALNFINTLPVGWEGMGEDIRFLLEQKNIRPKHHNAWGALINSALRRGLLEQTNLRKKSTGSKSHSTKFQINRRTTIKL